MGFIFGGQSSSQSSGSSIAPPPIPDQYKRTPPPGWENGIMSNAPGGPKQRMAAAAGAGLDQTPAMAQLAAGVTSNKTNTLGT